MSYPPKLLFVVVLLVAPWAASADNGGPVITLSPPSLSFSALEGGPLPAPQSMTVTNSGAGMLDWNASSNQSWLTVTPASGRLSAGQSAAVTVQISAQPQAESWTPMSSVNAPSAREDHDAAWTGSRMVLWGGELWGSLTNTGGVYDPVTNTWTGATSLVNAPTPRTLHTLTWTGQQVIVWGGSTGAGGGDTYYNQGYKYDPAANQWLGTISTQGAPSPRSFHTAVWTGSRMIIWGGYNGIQRLNTGGIYDPVKNKWVGSTSTVNAPAPRLHHVAVWTGTEMIVWGGQDDSNNLSDGARYNPTTDTWTPISTVGAPIGRQAAVAAWTGWEMLIWGGYISPGNSTQTGARYNPTTDTWGGETTLENALSARQSLSGAWTGSKFILSHGAHSGGPFFDDGAIYSPAVLPRGTHLATIKVSGPDGLMKTAPVTLSVSVPPPPDLRITGAAPVPGSTVGGSADTIVLTLNEALDSSSIDSSSVKLLRAGPDGVFGTSDDVVLTPAVSLLGTNQIQVSLAGIPILNEDLRLVISGTPPAFSGRFGHWKLDEGTGVSTADASGNGRVGILDNVAWSVGRVGNGLHFTGGAERVNIDAGTIPPSWSAAMWIKREDSPNLESRIMDCQAGDTFGTSLRLEQFNPADRVGFTTYNIQDYFFDYIAPVNTWTHLTFVGTASGTSLYANGTLIGTHPASVSLFVAKLGSFSINAMKGILDEVQVYSRALTAAEILSLARLDGTVRGTSGRVLDGDYAGSFPTGDGVSGGDFQATYRR